ncbi:MAG: hypothetical protein JSR80_07045 [Verrucomicrobia bacterium]|nr:hypothetical protein [Verrucomicrobiota bacterium]
MEKEVPIAKPYVIATRDIAVPQKSSLGTIACLCLSCAGLIFTGAAFRMGKIRAKPAAALAFSSTLLAAAPCGISKICTQKSTSIFRVRQKDLTINDLLDHLQQNPQIEELDLTHWTEPGGEQQDGKALFAYLCKESSPKIIHWHQIWEPNKLDLDLNKPSEEFKRFLSKLTHFPHYWEDCQKVAVESENPLSLFDLMPNLRELDLSCWGSFNEWSSLLVKKLYSRPSPPTLLQLSQESEAKLWETIQKQLLEKSLNAASPEAKFIASLQKLPDCFLKAVFEDKENGEKLFTSILPYCKKLSLLDFDGSLIPWRASLATAIEHLDPHQLTLVLPREEEEALLEEALKSPTSLSAKDKTALRFLKKLKTPVKDANVAIALLTNHQGVKFKLNTYDSKELNDEELKQLTLALSSSAHAQMTWDHLNGFDEASDAFWEEEMTSPLFQLSCCYIKVLRWPKNLPEDAAERLQHLSHASAIVVGEEIQASSLCKTFAQGKILIADGSFDPTPFFDFNPAAFLIEKTQLDQKVNSSIFEEKNYEICVASFQKVGPIRQYLSSKTLTHFLNSELPSDCPWMALDGEYLDHLWKLRSYSSPLSWSYRNPNTEVTVELFVYLARSGQPLSLEVLDGIAQI